MTRVFHPHAESIALETNGAAAPLARIRSDGIFEWRGAHAPAVPYALLVTVRGRTERLHDPYACAPQPATDDL